MSHSAGAEREKILRTQGRKGEDMTDFLLTMWNERHAQGLLDAYVQNPDIHRQMDELVSAEDARRLIAEQYAMSAERAVWCVEANKQPVGAIGVTYSGISDSGFDREWVFYWNVPPLRGSGIMKHLVKQVCDWALGNTELGTSDLMTADISELVAQPSPCLRRLELGYRANNPTSASVAQFAGFSVEGCEREKFLVDGTPVDVITAGRLATGPTRVARNGGLHHIELWVSDFSHDLPAWTWLFQQLGWRVLDNWTNGVSFQDPISSTYCVLEQSPDVQACHNRMNAGLNHIAFRVREKDMLDRVRSDARQHGWEELFGQSYPHAGGSQHMALYLENSQGFEVEIVAD